MKAGIQDIAEQYWRAEETRDVAAILDYYHADGELIVPEMGKLRGHSEIKLFYEASINRFPSLQVEILSGFEVGERGAFEWRARFLDHEGRQWNLQGVNVVTVRDNRFEKVHVYYDSALLDESGLSPWKSASQ
ncbi:MAG: hypothetical protein C7B45_17475 [Sulfobacillus acidophilus]|uniref:SnoaL-like domain-containing protein n=1 Tax=Sulfobacillus acidophilus TaxID=53633 RepID=A0A2T2WCG6_9FIRM|nr:MAG: hypothetical protein C7B45_17475 [Sulfobacillus acidophilus]